MRDRSGAGRKASADASRDGVDRGRQGYCSSPAPRRPTRRRSGPCEGARRITSRPNSPRGPTQCDTTCGGPTAVQHHNLGHTLYPEQGPASCVAAYPESSTTYEPASRRNVRAAHEEAAYQKPVPSSGHAPSRTSTCRYAACSSPTPREERRLAACTNTRAENSCPRVPPQLTSVRPPLCPSGSRRRDASTAPSVPTVATAAAEPFCRKLQATVPACPPHSRVSPATCSPPEVGAFEPVWPAGLREDGETREEGGLPEEERPWGTTEEATQQPKKLTFYGEALGDPPAQAPTSVSPPHPPEKTTWWEVTMSDKKEQKSKLAPRFGKTYKGKPQKWKVPKFNEKGELVYQEICGGTTESLNTEFIYYSSTLRVSAPLLSRREDKLKVIPWIKKLFSPEYQTTRLMEKRNRYLLYLTIMVLNDEVVGIFNQSPPEGALPTVDSLRQNGVPEARWQLETFWEDLTKGYPLKAKTMPCSVHEDCSENDNDVSEPNPMVGVLLDQEFNFFLHLARPYATILSNSDDKTKVALWLTALASIRPCACLYMKGIRNDYMQCLLGYLQDLRLEGPFTQLPPAGYLEPLAEAVKRQGKRDQDVLNPTGKAANEFLSVQPRPVDGAFCYIAVAGELADSNLIPKC